MSDIVERLRAVDSDWETTPCYNGTRLEAADEIERLRAEVEALRELLREARDLLVGAFDGECAFTQKIDAELEEPK